MTTINTFQQDRFILGLSEFVCQIQFDPPKHPIYCEIPIKHVIADKLLLTLTTSARVRRQILVCVLIYETIVL